MSYSECNFGAYVRLFQLEGSAYQLEHHNKQRVECLNTRPVITLSLIILCEVILEETQYVIDGIETK